jgi:signal transduction histidine kinase
MTRRTALVALAALIGVAGAIVAVVLAAERGTSVALDTGAFLAGSMVYLAVAVVICIAKPGHPVGLLALVGTSTSGIVTGMVELGERGLLDHPGSVPAAGLLLAVGSAARAVGWVLLVAVLPLVFPDGRLTGSVRRQRVSRGAAVGALVFLALGSGLAAQESDLRLEGHPNPLGLPDWVTSVAGFLSVGGTLLTIACVVLAIMGLVARWRHGDPLLRQQVLWFALAFVVPILFLPYAFLGHATAWEFAVVLLPVPIALLVAMLQHQLYDVQLVVSRTLTWVVLSAVVAVLYAVVVGGVGAMLRTRGAVWLPWLAAGVVAVSFSPLRNGLQAGVNRIVYGQWSQSTEVLAATGRRLSDAADVPALLQTLTDELAVGLALDHVSIRDAGGRTLSSRGIEAAGETLPLTAYGEVVGELAWSGRRLRDVDRRLLDDVARQLGGVVHSWRLVDELRVAQERLVLASEDERRRLRRDLHDGLGPALAGLTLQVDTVRNVLDAGGSADEHLLRLRTGIQSTVVDVRRIVEGLRPPALDELGLSGAVEELARRLTAQNGCVIDVAASQTPRLAAAVEVAAYRVAQEAMTNVVRHSGASRCTVHVDATDGELQVRVQDNGTGVVRPRPGGVGLASMHERAAEIGGRLDLVAVPGSGTTVALHLPLAAS